MLTRIKICGITRPEDAQMAAESGASAIGLVFYKASVRAVDAERARAIVSALPPFISVVGLFVNADYAAVSRILAEVPLDLLQFHGQESPEECLRYGRPYIKAIAMTADVDLLDAERRYASARALLLDSYQEGRPGGTGQTFDWARVSKDLRKPVILAGGLNADNVVAAIAQVRPYAVDVSGGVESAPGVKDAARMESFCRRVRGGA